MIDDDDAGAAPATGDGTVHADGAATAPGAVVSESVSDPADRAAEVAATPGTGSGDVSGGVVAGTASAGTMTVTFKLYATLQDLLPSGAVKNAVPIEVATDVSLNDLIDRHKVPRELAHLVLVNGVFVCDADRDARGALQPGDVLAIWPPVAGG